MKVGREGFPGEGDGRCKGPEVGWLTGARWAGPGGCSMVCAAMGPGRHGVGGVCPSFYMMGSQRPEEVKQGRDLI